MPATSPAEEEGPRYRPLTPEESAALNPHGPSAEATLPVLNGPDADALFRETPSPYELAPETPRFANPLPSPSARARAARARVDRFEARLAELPVARPSGDGELVCHGGISFRVPHGWLDHSVLGAREQPVREFRRNVVLLQSYVRPDMDFRWFVGAQLHELLVKHGTPSIPTVAYHDHPRMGYWALATYRVPPLAGKGKALTQALAFFIRCEEGYVLCFSAHEDDFEQAWAEAFEPIIASFGFFPEADGRLLP